MSLRYEFVLQAQRSGTNLSELCSRYGISRKTGYKWLSRYQKEGVSGLEDHSRARFNQTHETPKALQEAVINLREKHPAWGGRKLHYALKAQGYPSVPSPSTITELLRKQGYLLAEVPKQKRYQRFEHEAPNRLWQMDFKGHFAMEQGRCFPLTILDDHSRFSLCLSACANEQYATVKTQLIEVFARYGLPERINTDNGSPWGSGAPNARFTRFSVWLIELGVKVSFSRFFHPQTNGKEERFHRSLKEELLAYHYFRNLAHAQHQFDQWRACYNLERPHEALGMQPPISRYRPSYRPYQPAIQPYDYSAEHTVIKVDGRGRLHFKGKTFFVGTAFNACYLGIRPTLEAEDLFDLYYRHQFIQSLSLQNAIND